MSDHQFTEGRDPVPGRSVRAGARWRSRVTGTLVAFHVREAARHAGFAAAGRFREGVPMRAAASSFVDSDASRLRHEFASTPALILTVPQVARLLAVDVEEARELLAPLEAE